MELILPKIHSTLTNIRAIWRNSGSDDCTMLPSFLTRAVAYVIDYFLLYLSTMVVVEYGVNALYASGYFIANIEDMVKQHAISWSEAWGVLNMAIVTLVTSMLQFVIRPIYYIALEGKYGQTLGKKLCRLKVVRISSHTALGCRTANKRYWCTFLSHITLMTGFLAMLTNEKRQTLHDKLSQTLVVVL